MVAFVCVQTVMNPPDMSFAYDHVARYVDTLDDTENMQVDHDPVHYASICMCWNVDCRHPCLMIPTSLYDYNNMQTIILYTIRDRQNHL